MNNGARDQTHARSNAPTRCSAIPCAPLLLPTAPFRSLFHSCAQPVDPFGFLFRVPGRMWKDKEDPPPPPPSATPRSVASLECTRLTYARYVRACLCVRACQRATAATALRDTKTSLRQRGRDSSEDPPVPSSAAFQIPGTERRRGLEDVGRAVKLLSRPMKLPRAQPASFPRGRLSCWPRYMV